MFFYRKYRPKDLLTYVLQGGKYINAMRSRGRTGSRWKRPTVRARDEEKDKRLGP